MLDTFLCYPFLFFRNPTIIMNQKIRNEKLILFALLIILLLTYPLIAIVNKPILLMGIPILYLYIFFVWLIIVVIIKRLADKKNTTKDE